MAVTLTSTGITFSDGTNLNTAPSGGGGAQAFTTSGTWSHSAAGSPSTVMVGCIGGGGGATHKYSSYSNSPVPGGAGGLLVSAPISTNTNVAVTVGTGGNGGYGRSVGNASSFSGVNANGGGIGNYGYSNENLWTIAGATGNAGGNSSLQPAVSGNTNNGRGGTNINGAGQAGLVVVSW
jgi:hypothetical protein